MARPRRPPGNSSRASSPPFAEGAGGAGRLHGRRAGGFLHPPGPACRYTWGPRAIPVNEKCSHVLSVATARTSPRSAPASSTGRHRPDADAVVAGARARATVYRLGRTVDRADEPGPRRSHRHALRPRDGGRGGHWPVSWWSSGSGPRCGEGLIQPQRHQHQDHAAGHQRATERLYPAATALRRLAVQHRGVAYDPRAPRWVLHP